MGVGNYGPIAGEGKRENKDSDGSYQEQSAEKADRYQRRRPGSPDRNEPQRNETHPECDKPTPMNRENVRRLANENIELPLH
jgi:hypothetical protein